MRDNYILIITSAIIIAFTNLLVGQEAFPIDSLNKANMMMLEGEELRNDGKTVLGEEKNKQAEKLYSKIFKPNKKFNVKLGEQFNYKLEADGTSTYSITKFDDDCSYIFVFSRKHSNPAFITNDQLIKKLEMANENSKLEIMIEIVPSGYKSSTYSSGFGSVIHIRAKLLSVNQLIE